MGYSEKDLKLMVKKVETYGPSGAKRQAFVDYDNMTIQLPSLIMKIDDLRWLVREATNWITEKKAREALAKALSEAPIKRHTKDIPWGQGER